MADSGADRDVIGEQTIKRLNIGTTNADLRVVTVDNEIVSQRSLASFSIESPLTFSLRHPLDQSSVFE